MTAAVRKAMAFDDAFTPDAEPMPRGIDDERRGTQGMMLFIASEAMLFVMLFWSYFYLGHDAGAASWETPVPKLFYPLVMLGVLLTSSVVVHWAEMHVDGGDTRLARAAVFITAVLGLTFLWLQKLEYAGRLKEITPTTNAYGSIFYALTGLHGLHVALGVLMLTYVLMLPRMGHTDRPPYRPLHNAAMYWHFVDVVWVLIVVVVYVLPHLRS
jgi:heme/copper-type cytochrome/quinol oxidase subunit 3